jgi:hypothetical protein
MRFLLIVLGIVVFGVAGIGLYATQIKAPEIEIEVVIPDGDLPS